MKASETKEQILGSETAYPLPDGHTQVTSWQAGYGEYRATEATAKGGLTKRELFAMAAMQSLLVPIVGDDDPQLWSYGEIANSAVKAADALLKELAK